jgi:murein DD-endopeptidase MepM/ murein hydrolase activator NlpD
VIGLCVWMRVLCYRVAEISAWMSRLSCNRRTEKCWNAAEKPVQLETERSCEMVSRTCDCVKLGEMKLVRAIALSIFMLAFLATAAVGQLGGFQCPMKGTPKIRQGDSVAASGGRFDSARGSGRKHGALDLNGSVGDGVYASLEGRVAVAQSSWGEMGNTVIIDHGAGAYTVYGHLDSILVKEGFKVKTGDKVGTVGYTGNASSLKSAGLPPHLHFALIQAGKSGLADSGKPLRQMKAWGDYWQSLGADLTGAVDPALFVSSDGCWTGSTTVNAPNEK